MIVDTIFDWLNSRNFHHYYFLTPLPYAIGNCSEEIYYGLIKARNTNRKLFLLKLYDFPSVFKYTIANKRLWDLDSEYIESGKPVLRLLLNLLIF